MYGVEAGRCSTDEYYCQLLEIWDCREGWTGQCYDPRQAQPLKASLRKLSHDAYYRAFALVVGEPYSTICWDIHLGARWQNKLGHDKYRRLRSLPHHRRAGRRRSTDGPVAAARATGGVDACASVEENPEIAKFYLLASQGLAPDAVLAQVELPDSVLRTLRDPKNRRKIDDFFARQKADD
jgi:hypothetical protein